MVRELVYKSLDSQILNLFEDRNLIVKKYSVKSLMDGRFEWKIIAKPKEKENRQKITQLGRQKT